MEPQKIHNLSELLRWCEEIKAKHGASPDAGRFVAWGNSWQSKDGCRTYNFTFGDVPGVDAVW